MAAAAPLRVQAAPGNSVQWLFITALDQDLVTISKNQRAESIPLRLINPFIPRRKRGNSLREHGQNGRINKKIHIRWLGLNLPLSSILLLALRLSTRLFV